MFQNLLNEGTFVKNMVARDVRSYFISKKQRRRIHMFKFAVAEVSAINTELSNSCKEKKKYQTDLPSKVKNEVGNMHSDMKHKR